jgi:hypothetical protein
MIKFLIVFLSLFSSFCIGQSRIPNNYQFQLRNLLIDAFNGEHNIELDKVKWNPYKKEIVATSEDGYAYTAIDSVISFSANNENFILVILRTNVISDGFEEQCSSCKPSLGLALFKDYDSKLELTSFNRSIRNIGQAGLLPDYSIIELSSESKGLLLIEANTQDSDTYSYVYSLDETNVSNLVFEFANYRKIDENQSKYQTSTLNILTEKRNSIENTIFQVVTTSFITDKKIGEKKVNYKFNGVRWEPNDLK